MKDDEPKEEEPKPYDHCPRCGSRTEMGYGLAGGGIGPYEYCPQCHAIVNKWQEGDDE